MSDKFWEINSCCISELQRMNTILFCKRCSHAAYKSWELKRYFLISFLLLKNIVERCVNTFFKRLYKHHFCKTAIFCQYGKAWLFWKNVRKLLETLNFACCFFIKLQLYKSMINKFVKNLGNNNLLTSKWNFVKQ